MTNLFFYPLSYSLCTQSVPPEAPNHSFPSDERLDYSQTLHQPLSVIASPVHKQNQHLPKSTKNSGLMVERWLQELAKDSPWSMIKHVQEVDLFSRPFSDPADLDASANNSTPGKR